VVVVGARLVLALHLVASYSLGALLEISTSMTKILMLNPKLS
jgi:hypothetical protein